MLGSKGHVVVPRAEMGFFLSPQKAYTEDELNAKLTRRVQKAARRQAKQEELKRLHRAQVCLDIFFLEISSAMYVGKAHRIPVFVGQTI